MKPREQKSQSLKQAKGLARWDWIKRYLNPAMNYIGLSSTQFDRLFIGGDQMVKERGEVSPFPLPKIQVGGGTIYEPTWMDTSNGLDGYFYAEWRCTFNNRLVAENMITPAYAADGAPVFTEGFTPRFAFYVSEQLNMSSLAIRQDAIGLSDYDTIKMLLAARISGKIYAFAYTNTMTVSYAFTGAQNVFFYPSQAT